jgi:hypothetical protein
MILILLILIFFVLVLILIKICSKDRKPIITADDHRDVAIRRVVWGTVLLLFGIFIAPPVLLLVPFLFAYGYVFFNKAKRLRQSENNERVRRIAASGFDPVSVSSFNALRR